MESVTAVLSDGRPLSSMIVHRPSGRVLAPLRVLVVDDDEMVREVIALTLLRQGWTVDTAADGLNAIDLLSRVAYHLVVTDLNLPVLDGAALLGEIADRWPHLPVIIISGAPWDTPPAGLAGPRRWELSKPFAPAVLAALAQDVMRDTPPQG